MIKFDQIRDYTILWLKGFMIKINGRQLLHNKFENSSLIDGWVLY